MALSAFGRLSLTWATRPCRENSTSDIFYSIHWFEGGTDKGVVGGTLNAAIASLSPTWLIQALSSRTAGVRCSNASISATAAPASLKPAASAALFIESFLIRKTDGGVLAIRSARLSTAAINWSAGTQ